ncbi:MAG: type II toxin-antitoxin system PemK/MazF family toxin [Candidatus Aminicenantia bacterium]
MVINQGDIFWVQFPPAKGSEPASKRPALVIQSNLFNRSKINTTIVLAITSQLKYKNLPGNVYLKKGEANLPKSCVINVTQIATIDKTRLIEKIGTLSQEKIAQVFKGINLLFSKIE